MIAFSSFQAVLPPSGADTIVLRCKASKLNFRNGKEKKPELINPNFRFTVYLSPREGPVRVEPPYPWWGMPISSYKDTSYGARYTSEKLIYKYGNIVPLKDGLSELAGDLTINRSTLNWDLTEIGAISGNNKSNKTIIVVQASGACTKEKLPARQF